MKAVCTRHPRLLVLLALVLGVIGFWQEAHAQMGMGMDPSQFMANIGKRSLDDYARVLSLDADQKEALKGLYEGYTAARKQIAEEMQKSFSSMQEKMQDGSDFKTVQKDMVKQMQDQGAKAEKLEKGFFDDFKSLLNTKQQESWPAIERHRRREKGMRFGFISGQTVDLVKVIQAIKIDPKSVTGLSDQLEQYEVAMDREVQSFEKLQKDQEKMQADFDFDMSKLNEIMAKAKEMMKKAMDAGKGMRDVNRQYERLIEPLLPEDQRPKFEAEVNRRTHPRIFKESYATEAINAALGFSDLSGDQKTTLAEIKASYAQELAASNKRWASATEEREDKTGGQMIEMMDSMWGGQGGDDAKSVKEAAERARSDRKELDKQTKNKVLALLSEEQKKRLPEEKKEQPGMFGMGDFVTPSDEEDSK